MKTKRTTIALTLAIVFATMPMVSNTKASAAIAQNPNAVLQSMEITINTLNNDKDADTRLEVWINKAGEREAAYLDIQRAEHGGWLRRFPHRSERQRCNAPGRKHAGAVVRSRRRLVPRGA